MTPESLAGEVSSLFSLPDVALRACALIDSDTATEQEIAEVVCLDAGLAATVLRLANSALYGHFGKVETITVAIAMIGHKALRNMVLATSAVNAFKDIPEEFVDMETFWDNSVTCGVVASRLARHLRLPDAEALFVAGLLHAVGRLVFYARRPADYREVLHLAEHSPLCLAEAELNVFGFDYASLGAALLKAWGLPEKLQIAVGFQLAPDRAPAYAREVAVVHLANDIAASLSPCLKSRQTPAPYVLQPGHGERLGQEISQDDIDEIRFDAIATSLEIIEIIRPGATTIF